MNFTIDKQENNARTGILKTEKNEYKTPLYMVYTRNGVVPNITCDLLEGILTKPTILEVSIWDVVANSKTLEKFQQETKKSPKTFYHMENFDVFLHIRDCLHAYSNVKVSKAFMSGDTFGGSVQLSTKNYLDFVKLFKPEMYVSIHDVETKKEKTIEWMKDMNSQLEKEKIEKSCLFSHFYAKKNPKETMKQFKELLTDNVKGISFSELSFDFEDSLKQLSEYIHELSDFSNLPRLISGYDHPKLVLESVERGIDFFDGTYPFISAEFGQALIFPLSIYDKKQDLLKNLRDLKFQKSKEPLLIGCECLACKDHTCGYIHHLLNTKELLGHVLLT
jgi:queuine tRNA-ribosyltransferase accessory subunit